MQLISNNPFRILGVKANASLSDRNQQANLIAQYLKIGQSAKLDLDITPPLEPLTRTKELIDLQASRIFSTEDKILHSLFWFVEANGIDKIALKHLTGSKDIHKALSDFEKGCRGFVVSPESYSAILNHSTLQIIAYKQHKDLDKLKSAIANKFDIITNKKTLAQIKDLVASDGINTDFQKILELTMPMVKELLNELVPSENTDKLLLDIFKSNTVIYPSLKNKVIQTLLDKIDNKVNNTEIERKKALKGIYKPTILIDVPALGAILINSVKSTLNEIAELLGNSDPVYMESLQKVYQEVNFCGILPFNKMIEKLNSTNGKANETIIENADFEKILSLFSKSMENLNDVSIPIKTTILKNIEGIKGLKLKSNCEFCSDDIPAVASLKVKMHKMTGINQYSYFKNGGLELKCCGSCKNKKNINYFLYILIATLVYGGIAALTSGIFIFIDLWFGGFGIGKWWYRLIKKLIFYNNLKNHSTIKEQLRDGYEFGMP
jgi:hypothetical protein